MEDPLLGQKLGNYVVQSLIGRGGMGAVYVAEHPEIGRRVAVKVLAPELGHVPGLSERFVAEARAATRIEHPNVITIFDFGRTASGQLYQVIELLRGRDLSQVIAARGAFQVEEVVPYVEQLCDGLAAAHEQGVIHRDLKPENVFVLDRTPLALKILDFGIAKLLEPGAQQTHTVTGMVIGSPFTIAPEQAAGQRDAICPQTDLYSLGVILYWLLAGRPPFADAPTAVLLAKHITDQPPPLLSLLPALSPPVAALVHRCLEKDPARRPGSARELREGFLAAARAPFAATLPPLEPRSVIPATVVGQTTPTPGDGPGWATLPGRGPAPGASGTTLGGAASEVVARPRAPRRRALWLGLAAAAVAAVASAATIALWPGTPRPGTDPDPRLAVAAPAADLRPAPSASEVSGLPATRPDAAPRVAAKPDATSLVASPDAAPRPAAKAKAIASTRTPPPKPAAVGTRPTAKLPPAALDATVAEARRAYVAGQPRRAIQLAREVLSSEPNHRQALLVLGVAACQLKDERSARFAYDRIGRAQANLLRQTCLQYGIALRVPGAPPAPAGTGGTPPPAAARRTPPPTAAGGTLSASEVALGFRAVRGRVAACYRQHRVPGTVRILVTIAPSGSVSSARVTGELAGSSIAACIELAALAARFRAFAGHSITISYPFVLR